MEVTNMCGIGEDFNFSALMDDYQIVRELGQGGFGKVMLGKHKEEKKEVAIKFMDVSENRNFLLTHQLLLQFLQLVWYKKSTKKPSP